MTSRAQQAQQTYEHIFSTAETLLQDSSYEKLSVDQICKHANISKGGFYHHFSSKEQLIAILIGRQMENLLIQKIEPYLNKKSTFELLNIYIDVMVEYLESNSRSILARCWTVIAEHPEMIDSLLSKGAFQLLYAIVEQGKQERCISTELDNDFCYAYINATITGIILYGSTFRDKLYLRTFAENSLKLIYQTLASPNFKTDFIN